jgi:2'-5' RNA ligase
MVEQPAESVILIPVPETTDLLLPYRLRFDPSAGAGVVEHITLLYPFLPPPQIDDAVLGRLQAFFSGVSPFSFVLRSIGWFEQGVLYLAPDPPDPFIALTNRLSSMFNVLPFEGRFPTVVPHLTIAEHGATDALEHVAASVAGHLPITGRTAEAWLMLGHNDTGWTLHHRFHLSGSS